MSNRRSGALLGAGLLLFAFVGSGCAKRVPLEDGNFEAPQLVVLTLKDGRTLKGHIDPGQTVEYIDHGAIYRARVAVVGKDSLSLDDVILIDRQGSYQLLSDRISDARLQTEAPLAPVAFARSDIDKVELVRFDTWKTIRKAAFWTYGGALFVLFLGQRS